MAYVDPSVALRAARICGKDPVMDSAAARVKATVLRAATASRLTGAFMDGIVVLKVRGESGTGVTVQDRTVTSTDPATLSIEYGHLTGRTSDPIETRRHVPGKFVLTGVAKTMGNANDRTS